MGPETCILTQTILTLVKHLSFATNRSLHSFIIYDIIFFLFFSKEIKTVKTGVCFGGLYSLEEITSKKGEDCGAIRNLVGIRGDGPGGDMGEEARLDMGEDKVGRSLALPATRVSPPCPSKPPQPMFQLCRSGQPQSRETLLSSPHTGLFSRPCL